MVIQRSGRGCSLPAAENPAGRDGLFFRGLQFNLRSKRINEFLNSLLSLFFYYYYFIIVVFVSITVIIIAECLPFNRALAWFQKRFL